MKELLGLAKGKDFYPAYQHLDEAIGKVVDVEKKISKEAFRDFMNVRKDIQARQLDVQAHAIAIGYWLARMQDDNMHHYITSRSGTYGYSSFYAFCKDVFGFSDGTVRRLTGVAREFCGISEKTKSDKASDKTAEEHIGVLLPYINFSFSQLAEMLGMEDKLRSRITVQCSVRDIRRLKELYKTYVPKENTTVEDDLKEYQRLHQEENEAKNAKKNAIMFIPANPPKGSSPTSESIKNPPVQGENGVQENVSDDYDGADERDVITPTVSEKIPFEQIKNGLLRQLELLCQSEVGIAWKKSVDIFKEALESNVPRKVARGFDLMQERIKTANLQAELSALKSGKVGSIHSGKSGEKLNLKNEKARREWLEDFRSWGIWLDVQEVARRYYRYNFVNGTSMIVCVWLQYRSYSSKNKAYEEISYTVLDKDHEEFDGYGLGGLSKAVEWLTKNGKEI